jgi:hypothetical protein
MAESADGRSASNSAAENRFADATEEDAEADPVFQVRGTQIKKLRRAEGGAKIFGVFRVKNHDFTPKNHIFSNFRGAPPWIRPWDVFNILVNIKSKNTNKSTRFAIKLLRDYCLSKNRNVDFENMDINELKTLLKEFYINLRNQNGELYSRSSFVVIRHIYNVHDLKTE